MKHRRITEAKLRRIVREELVRQVLIQEGFLDSIKQSFSKIKDKSKEWILEKSIEITKKLDKNLMGLEVPGEMKDFMSTFQKQEGGVSIDELSKMVSGLAEGKSSLEKIKEIDFREFLDVSKNESYSLDQARSDYIVAEEKYNCQLEGNAKEYLNESILAGALTSWYAFSKTVITSLSLVIFLLEGAEKITNLLGLSSASKVFGKLSHFFEKVEDWFLTKAIFPAPVQYAAYLAFSKLKKFSGKVDDKILSFKEFQSHENEELREKVIKGLKIALLCIVVVEALTHIGHALKDFFQDVHKSASNILHAGEHAGIETKNIVKTASELGTKK